MREFTPPPIRHWALLALLLVLQVPVQLYAGDHECIVQFTVHRVLTSGQTTPIAPTVIDWVESYTVELQAGESVRLIRECPGCNNCPPNTGIERRLGATLDHATHADPILDTLPISYGVSPTFSTPGSYYLRGVCSNCSQGMSRELRIVAVGTNVVTGIAAVISTDLNAWSEAGYLHVSSAPPGEMRVLDMAGRTVAQSRVQGSKETERIPLTCSAGVYIAMLISEQGQFRRRFYHP